MAIYKTGTAIEKEKEHRCVRPLQGKLACKAFGRRSNNGESSRNFVERGVMGWKVKASPKTKYRDNVC
jgi:hypothetical protein